MSDTNKNRWRERSAAAEKQIRTGRMEMPWLDAADAFLDIYDSALSLRRSSECCWEAGFHVHQDNGPCAQFDIGGASDPEDAMRRVLRAVSEWLKNGGKPLPVEDH